MESVVGICKEVLKRLASMDYEKEGLVSSGQLIFPSKRDSTRRISEQELRQLFIEEFKEKHKNLYFSIETPTLNRYSFTNKDDTIKIADYIDAGQSALIDLSIYDELQDSSKNYIRLLNVEFKHKNATEVNISKDILKLMHEEENGAFVLLLKNTNAGTLNNLAETRFGVIDKLITSLTNHNSNELHWKGNAKKSIELIIISLEEKKVKTALPFIYYCTIKKDDLDNLQDKAIIWRKEVLDDGEYLVIKVE